VKVPQYDFPTVPQGCIKYIYYNNFNGKLSAESTKLV